MSNNKAVFTKDTTNNTITVVRPFAAPLPKVWKAWTDSAILDQWWAPKPFKAVTKTMDFREGGMWLYCMEGPNGEKHWNRVDYSGIDPQKSIEDADMFCDENGVRDTNMPSMKWKKSFAENGNGTTVTIVLTFDSPEQLQAILTMGFEEGFTMGLDNLDELFEEGKA